MLVLIIADEIGNNAKASLQIWCSSCDCATQSVCRLLGKGYLNRLQLVADELCYLRLVIDWHYFPVNKNYKAHQQTIVVY